MTLSKMYFKLMRSVQWHNFVIHYVAIITCFDNSDYTISQPHYPAKKIRLTLLFFTNPNVMCASVLSHVTLCILRFLNPFKKKSQ